MILLRIQNRHNEIYNYNSKTIRYNATLIPSSCMCCSYMLCVCGCVFCLFLFCLYICVCIHLQIQGPLRECRSIRPGASGLPYYCAPLVCVPDLIGLLPVWRHNQPKTNLRTRMSSNRKSIAGVSFISVGSSRSTLLLRTTCMHSCCNWSASCAAALQTKNQKPKLFWQQIYVFLYMFLVIYIYIFVMQPHS